MVFVSVVMPVRNEEAYVGEALESIFLNDYPKDRLEILVVDGDSDDRTLEVVDRLKKKCSALRVIQNPNKTAPHAMNIGVRSSSGDVVIRMDAHAIYPSNYISTLVSALDGLSADNVGACIDTVPANSSKKAIAIARVMSHPFGVGDSQFRIAPSNGSPVMVDTVPFGCYRRDVFERVGYFDEDLVRNQDNEFNERLVKAGGKIYLVPSLRVGYVARSTLVKLWGMFFQYGYFGPLVDLKLGQSTRIRRYVPLVFVMSLLLPLIGSLFVPEFAWVALVSFFLYISVGAYFSKKMASEECSVKVGLYALVGFFTAHFSYGLGHLKGLFDFVVMRKHLKGRVNVGLTR